MKIYSFTLFFIHVTTLLQKNGKDESEDDKNKKKSKSKEKMKHGEPEIEEDELRDMDVDELALLLDGKKDVHSDEIEESEHEVCICPSDFTFMITLIDINSFSPKYS